jgi:hypothetical protein
VDNLNWERAWPRSIVHGDAMDTDDTARRAVLTSRIRTAAQLEQFWRALLEPLGFGQRTLWVQLLAEDGLPIPQTIQIDDVPLEQEPAMCRSLMEICSTVLEENAPDGSVAVLLSRPGRDGMREDDRCWARDLTEAGAELGVNLWPVHLANDLRLQVFAPDDLLPLTA